ncbi:Aste57867_24642 [Aphanomyces stellatus]|uniref:Aste57867_24642 protein n=1 Tax=Aphanomyces stellatus TaxID=120398 RepID=A0A485LQZ7_9STRA|nr:hypothetical protein As57867_024564 [Aphanomyces stellatus]VFU01279.1 Aste57867_24642 [Aphanomyces stellatus]
MKLLSLDLPFEVRDRNLVPRQRHLYSWAKFMDVTRPVNLKVRLNCLKAILNDSTFETCSQELLREVAFAKDQHGREVIQITDASTRKYFNDRLFFCGRYEIFQGPPVHVSNTAVVVMAYDYGICAQVFEQHKNVNGELGVSDFIKCNKVLGRVGSKIEYDQNLNDGKWAAEFCLWDKDSNGSLSEDEFLRYCAQYCGKKLKVAMKFMKNADEYDREICNRANLDDNFVLSLLPCVNQSDFQAGLKTLKPFGGYTMTEYPHLVVMPAADRSLEDIYLKERPGENERRIFLQQVAEGLQHLHNKGLVHGDVKKLNMVRVDNRLKLIDLDATTKIGDPIGAKFSSGILPPELFYKFKSDKERQLYLSYWANVGTTNLELWDKVKPKNDCVVKTFYLKLDELPYTPILAQVSLDAWAFGALMYQMHSGEELVSTDINQDVLDDTIEQAITWTQCKLKTRIRNKIRNDTVCDLIEKLLVVDPQDRIDINGVLNHPYFQVDSMGLGKSVATLQTSIMDAQNEIIRQIQEMNKNTVAEIKQSVDDVGTKVDYVASLSEQNLTQLAKTKQDIMRGVFEATEAIIPTSFVLLPENLTKTSAKTGEKNLNSIVKYILDTTTDSAKSLAKAMKTNSGYIYSGDPMFLYLVDEVEGVPVIPSATDSVYPIRIDTQPPEFLAFVIPYLEGGLRLLNGMNTASKLAKCIGIPSPKSVVDNAIQLLEAIKNESSVVDFNVVHSAVLNGSESPRLVQRIRGAALRELERFFNEMDPEKTYAGLQRTYTADGHALWTSRENAEKIKADKPRPETLMATHEQSSYIVEYYNKFLLDKEEKKIEDTSGDIANGRENEDKEEIEPRRWNLTETNSCKEKLEKVCSCELM